jgi:hypothetical protein
VLARGVDPGKALAYLRCLSRHSHDLGSIGRLRRPWGGGRFRVEVETLQTSERHSFR